jgi:hypothetical protein
MVATHAEGSAIGFVTESVAAHASLEETIWPNATMTREESNRWVGRDRGRRVVLVTTEQNETGGWDWGGLAFCAG